MPVRNPSGQTPFSTWPSHTGANSPSGSSSSPPCAGDQESVHFLSALVTHRHPQIMTKRTLPPLPQQCCSLLWLPARAPISYAVVWTAGGCMAAQEALAVPIMPRNEGPDLSTGRRGLLQHQAGCIADPQGVDLMIMLCTVPCAAAALSGGSDMTTCTQCQLIWEQSNLGQPWQSP